MSGRINRDDPAYANAMREAKAQFDAAMAKSAMKGRGRTAARQAAATAADAEAAKAAEAADAAGLQSDLAAVLDDARRAESVQERDPVDDAEPTPAPDVPPVTGAAAEDAAAAPKAAVKAARTAVKSAAARGAAKGTTKVAKRAGTPVPSGKRQQQRDPGRS